MYKILLNNYPLNLLSSIEWSDTVIDTQFWPCIGSFIPNDMQSKSSFVNPQNCNWVNGQNFHIYLVGWPGPIIGHSFLWLSSHFDDQIEFSFCKSFHLYFKSWMLHSKFVDFVFKVATRQEMFTMSWLSIYLHLIYISLSIKIILNLGGVNNHLDALVDVFFKFASVHIIRFFESRLWYFWLVIQYASLMLLIFSYFIYL